MQLPAGFEHRASSIAHLVGESISEFQTSKSLMLDSISIGSIQVSPNATDQDIAAKVARQILAKVGEAK